MQEAVETIQIMDTRLDMILKFRSTEWVGRMTRNIRFIDN